MTNATLRDFGYAPGYYTIRCSDCHSDDKRPVDLPLGDKRAWRCEPCAQKRLDECNGANPSPCQAASAAE